MSKITFIIFCNVHCTIWNEFIYLIALNHCVTYLLFGNNLLSLDVNVQIFTSVERFILETERFASIVKYCIRFEFVKSTWEGVSACVNVLL